MANVDFGRYKRLVRAFWDPEPKNDDNSGSCIWCLGKEYTSHPPHNREGSPPAAHEVEQQQTNNGTHARQGTPPEKPATNGVSTDEKQHTDGDLDKGWPPDFLDDCESRVWFTYRSNFPAIKKSSDASMTLSVRLRSIGEQGGFTSDTGWGCMIRSGQSLLANALVMLRLGRGVSARPGKQR